MTKVALGFCAAMLHGWFGIRRLVSEACNRIVCSCKFLYSSSLKRDRVWGGGCKECNGGGGTAYRCEV